MVIGDETLLDTSNSVSPPISPSVEGDSMNQPSLEMMESIIQRLQPQNRHDIRDMISNRGRISGTLGVAAMAKSRAVDIIRVHDVPEHTDLFRAMSALEDF